MNANKTRPGEADVAAFIDAVPDPQRRDDARELCAIMQRITGEPPVLWGKDQIGFGTYGYKYESGREGEWYPVGFSPRAKELVLYLLADAPDRDALLARLGRHRVGKSCLYLKRLADADSEVLERLIAGSLAANRARYPD